jgi:hypothetical protein
MATLPVAAQVQQLIAKIRGGCSNQDHTAAGAQKTCVVEHQSARPCWSPESFQVVTILQTPELRFSAGDALDDTFCFR